MPTQDLPTLRQVRSIRKDGEAEFITRGAVIQPGRHSFATQDELNAYLVGALGGRRSVAASAGFFPAKADMCVVRQTVPKP
jgi:hypothetical protein